MQLEKRLFVKTKKKETFSKFIDLLVKYSDDEEFDIEEYEDLTFGEDVWIEEEFFDEIYDVLKEDGIMIYAETDSDVDPYSDITYWFGDGVKGKNYDSEDYFYATPNGNYDVDYWFGKVKPKLTKKEYDRIKDLGLKGKNIELSNKAANCIIEDSVKYIKNDDGSYEAVAVTRGPKVIKIKKGTKRIYPDAIGWNDKMEKIVLPESLEDIPKGLFSNGCTALKTVTTYEYEDLDNVIKLPSCVDIIKRDMFRVGGFTNITIMEGIKEIEGCAFDDCSHLTSAVLPNSLEKIDSPFTYCENFKEYILKEGNERFSVEEGILYSKDKTTIYDLPNAYSKDYFIVPNTVEICTSAFVCCFKLKKLTLSNKIKKLSQYEFNDHLEEITIPPSVEKISVNAFSNCRKIKVIGEAGSFAEQYVKNIRERKKIDITFEEII